MRELKRSIVTCLLTVASLVMATSSCGTSSTETVVPAFLVVNPDSVDLYPLDSVALTVHALDKDSALLTGIAVTFRSSDTATVRVTNVGEVHAVGPAGTTTVIVAADGVTKNVPVVVKQKPAKLITAYPRDTVISEGSTVQLRTVVYDSVGDSIAQATRVFTSRDTSVVTVSGTGLVSGKGPGVAAVVVSANGKQTTVVVTVIDAAVTARIPLAEAPYGVAASSAGVVYVTQGLGSAVRRISMATFTLTDTVPVGANAIQVAFAAAGATALVTKRPSHSIGIIDVATHSQIDTIAIPGDPYPIRISGNGSTAYATSTDGWLYKIDIASRTRTDSAPASDPSTQLTLGPGDSLLYFSSQFGGTVTEARTATMTVVRVFPTGGTPQALAVSPDGTELYVADESGPLRIWSLTSGTQIDTVATDGRTFGVALTPDGTRLCVGTTAGRIFLIDRASRKFVHAYDVGGTPRNTAVDPVTGYCIVPNEAGGWVDIVK